MSIRKISQITGYSYATVARALSGSGYCSVDKKKRILQIAKEIDYKPNSSARSLRSNRSEKILFGIPDICNAFYFRMIEAATQALELNRYYPLIFNTQHSLEKELSLIDLLNQKYGDGLLLVSFNFINENIEAIRKSGLPVVITNKFEGQRETDNFDYVYADHTKGMELATEHLISCGCRDIVLIAGAQDEQTSKERIEGFKIVLERHNIRLKEGMVLNGGFSADGAYAAFKAFRQSAMPFDGVITANDLMCMGVMRYQTETGGRGHDYKLVSFDNTDIAANLQITSIDLCQELIGEEAVKLLMERLTQERTTAKSVYIEPKLIVRGSTVNI